MSTDPFTRTPGIAGKAYIDNGIADEIIKSLGDEESSKYIFKITGLRGSGKSVEYGRIIRTLKEKNDWLVYPLSSSGNGIRTLLAKISEEKFVNNKKNSYTIKTSVAAEGKLIAMAGKGSIDFSKTTTEKDDTDIEALLVRLIKIANEDGYKILIGIDDISKTPSMVELLSILSSMILEGLKVYLVVTGLSENIEDFSNEKNLSFFKRADSYELKNLNKYDVTFMYEKLLGVKTDVAKAMEDITLGYAYAYQVLGSLYYKKNESETLEDLMPEFERILFKDSYDLVWKSISAGEKDFLKAIYASKTGKASDIKALIKNAKNYPVIRERLINKHILDGDTRGILKVRLPRFDKYIEIWGSD
ncbi:hypothetical protein UYO_2270 [Lachnospiraceae bacterium JC7]|nr:hypothetical protein UYO_2270 [Lachnospiraceae bacterium JC7]